MPSERVLGTYRWSLGLTLKTALVGPDTRAVRLGCVVDGETGSAPRAGRGAQQAQASRPTR